MPVNCFKIFILFLLMLIYSYSYGQEFKVSTEPYNLKIDDQRIEGYQRTFDFPYKKMKKEFWRFVTDFGVLKNWRSHYEIIVPPGDKATAETRIYAMVIPAKTGALIATGKHETAMKGVPPAKLDALARQTLEEFQLYFFQKWLQEKIEDLEKESRKLSKKQARFSRKLERWQSKANSSNEKIARGKEELANIQNGLIQTLEQLDSYRAKLAALLK